MRYVLFVCVHNAGRSQMARALFDRHAPADVRAESAGSNPAEVLYPTVVAAMAEIGIDLSQSRPERLLVETQLHADRAITMGCEDACPYVPGVVEEWPVPDPAGRALDEVRLIRDLIESRVRDLIAHRLDDIRSSRSAHDTRLLKLLPPLVDEFAEVRAPQNILACAEAVLATFDDAAVRGHALNLALNRTRACLRAEHCDLLFPDSTPIPTRRT